MCETKYGNRIFSYSEEDELNNDIKELSKRVNERDEEIRDSMEPHSIVLTIAYAIVSALISIFAPITLSKQSPVWHFLLAILFIIFIYVFVYLVTPKKINIKCIKKLSQRDIKSSEEFSQDFIEYHNLTPSKRTEIDKKKRAKRCK